MQPRHAPHTLVNHITELPQYIFPLELVADILYYANYKPELALQINKWFLTQGWFALLSHNNDYCLSEDDLRFCPNIVHLTDVWGGFSYEALNRLPNLTSMTVRRVFEPCMVPKLRRLCASGSSVLAGSCKGSKLRELTLLNCIGITNEDLLCLPKLRKVSLDGESRITVLPEWVKSLHILKRSAINDSTMDFPHLEELAIDNQTLTSLCNATCINITALTINKDDGGWFRGDSLARFKKISYIELGGCSISPYDLFHLPDHVIIKCKHISERSELGICGTYVDMGTIITVGAIKKKTPCGPCMIFLNAHNVSRELHSNAEEEYFARKDEQKRLEVKYYNNIIRAGYGDSNDDVSLEYIISGAYSERRVINITSEDVSGLSVDCAGGQYDAAQSECPDCGRGSPSNSYSYVDDDEPSERLITGEGPNEIYPYDSDGAEYYNDAEQALW